ncbi:MAG TPA: penicillin-binding transpeptidase domain-containing protein [Longimicrobiales bacterium]
MKKIRLDSPHARARFAGAIVVAAIALLAVFFFRTQVLQSGADVLIGEGNRLRTLPLPAARGDILARDSTILAGTSMGTALVLMPAPEDSVRARIRRIGRLLGLPRAWSERAQRAALVAPRPYVATTSLRPVDVNRLAAARRELPGVLLEPWPHRVYPLAAASAGVVGTVGFEPWPRAAGENPAGVDAGVVVGRSGLELAYDTLLSGEAGVRYVEIDSAGGLITDPLKPAYREPVAGRAVRTSIDAELQRYVASVVPASLRAGAVVIDVQTGDVLALHSQPGRGADTSAAARANLAVGLVGNPRAVFQPVTAALALESGHVDVELPQTIPCRGGMRYGDRYFRCWQPDGHGYLPLAGALREACDVYFHQVALRLGLQALLDAGSRLGLGGRTGIELPEERSGSYPSTVGELAALLRRAPNPSDALDLGTGHGINRSTLIGMTHAYAILANGGSAPAPRLAGRERARDTGALRLPAERLTGLLDMLEAVTAPGGAAAPAGAAMAAGTRIRGQLTRRRDEPGVPVEAGWFVGLAGPVEGPDRIAVGVIVARPPSDALPAALAGRIADYYLRSEGGVPAPSAPDTTTPSSITVARL